MPNTGRSPIARAAFWALMILAVVAVVAACGVIALAAVGGR